MQRLYPADRKSRRRSQRRSRCHLLSVVENAGQTRALASGTHSATQRRAGAWLVARRRRDATRVFVEKESLWTRTL